MWKGLEPALAAYYNACVREWSARGKKNIECKIDEEGEEWLAARSAGKKEAVPWLGDDALHASHKSALLFKDPEYYSKFGWEGVGEPKVEYMWPRPVSDGTWVCGPPLSGKSTTKKAAEEAAAAKAMYGAKTRGKLRQLKSGRASASLSGHSTTVSTTTRKRGRTSGANERV